MVIYCQNWSINGVSLGDDNSTSSEAQYQILYHKYKFDESFSMNYRNKLTNTYHEVKKDSKLYKAGLKFAQNRWNSYQENLKRINRELAKNAKVRV